MPVLRANAHRRRSGRPAGTPRLSSQPDMVVAGRPRPQLHSPTPVPDDAVAVGRETQPVVTVGAGSEDGQCRVDALLVTAT